MSFVLSPLFLFARNYSLRAVAVSFLLSLFFFFFTFLFLFLSSFTPSPLPFLNFMRRELDHAYFRVLRRPGSRSGARFLSRFRSHRGGIKIRFKGILKRRDVEFTSLLFVLFETKRGGNYIPPFHGAC